MKKESFQPWFTLAARIFIAAIYFYATVRKIGNTSENVKAVEVYKILPVTVARYFGYALPWLELGIVLLLLFGISMRFTAIATAALSILYLIAISSAWARHLPINCGCFGNGGVTADGKVHPLIYLREIGINSLDFLFALYLYLNPFGKWGFDQVKS